jgi:two-component system chemotaxis response regulator CheB
MLALKTDIEVVLIGGSAGSLAILIQILKLLSPDFSLPIIIIIHRQRNVLSEMTKILSSAVDFEKIVEPDDKATINTGFIYIAPQNYHLLIEKDKSISLDYSEAIKFSRPSIDVTFESAARVYKDKLVSILLSGANNDGTAGMKTIVNYGGMVIAQEPLTADYPAMPMSAIKNVKGIRVMEPAKISELLNDLVSKGK